MKRIPIYLGILSGLVLTFLAMCNSAEQVPTEHAQKVENKTAAVKPPSSYNDTITVTVPSAVFYKPDSIQLEKIRAVTEKGVFESTDHEYFYQMRNAHIFLNENWKKLNVVDTKNIRFIVFRYISGESEIVDLNARDPYGMFVFDGKKPPLFVDMTNVETQVSQYFQ